MLNGLYVWYYGTRLAEQEDVSHLAKSYHRFDENKQTWRHVNDLTVSSPYALEDERRIKYTPEMLNRLCVKGEIDMFYMNLWVIDSDKYQEYQVIGKNTKTNETIITAVAYTKRVDIHDMILRDDFTEIDLDPRHKQRFIHAMKKYRNALYVELLCSPVESTGSAEAFFSHIKTGFRDDIDVILLKSMPDKQDFYFKLGFKRIEMFDLTNDKKFIDLTIMRDKAGLYLLYMPTRIYRKRKASRV